jgi:serine protease Do
MPINTAVKVYNDIIKNGKVTRGSIGVLFTPSESSSADSLLKAYGAHEGVFVQSVAPGGPAEKAGIKSGDIITGVEGKPIRNGGELVDRVTSTPIGNSLRVEVLRDSKHETFNVVVADLAQIFPDKFGSGKSEEAGPAEGTQARFGITIENLTEPRRQNMGLTSQHGGVLISAVEPGSFAEDILMQHGDVLVEINRQPVNTVDDVRRIQNALQPGGAVAFRVLRQNNGRGGNWVSVFLAGVLPNHP